MTRRDYLMVGGDEWLVTPAHQPLDFEVRAWDCEFGDPADPVHCAGSMGLNRIPDVEGSVVYRKVVYLLMRDPDKGPVAWRYVTSDAFRKHVIEPTDAGRAARPGIYRLHPSPRADDPEAIRARMIGSDHRGHGLVPSGPKPARVTDTRRRRSVRLSRRHVECEESATPATSS